MDIYIELIDDDRISTGEENNELIDRFNIPISGNSSRTTYLGVFGLAEITLSLTIRCSKGFIDSDCRYPNTTKVQTNSNMVQTDSNMVQTDSKMVHTNNTTTQTDARFFTDGKYGSSSVAMNILIVLAVIICIILLCGLTTGVIVFWYYKRNCGRSKDNVTIPRGYEIPLKLFQDDTLSRELLVSAC